MSSVSVHKPIILDQISKFVFTSYSKKNFYLRSDISTFVLLNGNIPVSPFMNFDYNLASLVPKDSIRIANNTLINKCDELWVFGAISDGVLIEIYIAKKQNKPVRYFIQEQTASFKEISEDDIRLEDVSPWMWQWVIEGKSLERWHPRLRFNKTYPLVYPAYSKRNFYWQMHISQFCLEQKRIPLNPFMLFRYFLGDSVSRNLIYEANNNIVKLCDELWTFGDISDGVLSEIETKKAMGQSIKYFNIVDSNPVVFRNISPKLAKFEDKALDKFKSIISK